jgi:hypothetical protein
MLKSMINPVLSGKTLILTIMVLTLNVNISFAQLNIENFLKAPFISAFIEHELFTKF